MKTRCYTILSDNDLKIYPDNIFLEFYSMYIYDNRFKSNDTLIANKTVLDFLRIFKKLYRNASLTPNKTFLGRVENVQIEMKNCSKIFSIHLSHYTCSEYSKNAYLFSKNLYKNIKEMEKSIAQIDEAITYIRDEKLKEIDEQYNSILNI